MTTAEFRKKYGLGASPEQKDAASDREKALAEWREKSVQRIVKPAAATVRPQTGVRTSFGDLMEQMKPSASPVVRTEPIISPLKSVETGGKYYSKPNLWTDADRMEQRVTQTETNLKVLQRQAQDLAAAWQKSQTDTAYQMWQDVYNRYEAEYDAYTRYYDEYESYLTDQQRQYDDWRGTIRSAEQVQSEMAAVKLMIDAVKKDRAKNYLTTPANQLPEYDARIKQYEEQLAMLEEEYDWARRFAYEDLQKNPDFAELSKYKRTGETAKKNPITGVLETTGYGDVDYEIINRNEAARQWQSVRDIQYGAALAGVDQRERTQMTDDEIAIFNYLYAQDEAAGDKNHTSAYEYIDYITKDLTYRQQQKDAEWWSTYAKENPVRSSVFSAVMSPMKAVSAVGQVADYLDDGKIDENAGYNKFSHIPSNIRGAVSESVEEKWGKVGSFAYNTGMSMADFLVNTALSGGSSGLAMTLMGSEIAADTVIDGKKRGLSDGQAFTLGIVSGLAEAVTEKFSVEALLDAAKLGKSAFGYWIKNTITEASEEGASNLINTFADIMISKEKSEWQTAIDAYKTQGLSEEDAFYKALGDQAASIGLDMLGGAISGGTMAAPGVAVQGASKVTNAIIDKRQNVDKPSAESPIRAEKWFEPEVAEDGTYEDQDGNRVLTDGTKIEQDGTKVLSTADTREQGKRMERAKTVTARTGVATGATDGQIKTAERLSKILGKEIRFFRQDAAADGSIENGLYRAENDVILVNAASEKGVRWVVAHELTHSTELSSEYQTLNDFVISQMQEMGYDVDAMVNWTKKLYAEHGVDLKTDLDIKKEVVADFAADKLLTDEKTIRALVKAHPTVVQRMLEWADKLAAKIGKTESEEDEVEIMLRKARKMYAAALADADKVRKDGAVQKTERVPEKKTERETAKEPETRRAQETEEAERDPFDEDGDDSFQEEAVDENIHEVFPDAQFSVTRTAKEQDAIMANLRSILQNGGTVADLRSYVDTLDAQERAQAKKKPQGTNTQRRADAASQIVRAAHNADMTVEEYLRENAELYETEDGWNRDARRALEMERGERYSITKSDIDVLREIPNKSVNAFTSADIKKTEKWAKKFYKELGTKSPFFRAWFGDWRAYDTEQVQIVKVPSIDIAEAVLEKGNYTMGDTGWKVHAGKVLNDDTRHHSGGGRVNVKALVAIKEILKNSVLLDTVVSDTNTKKKSENTAFLHKFYSVIHYEGAPYIAKTTVEEYYNEAENGISRRAYNLKAIKIEPAGGQLGITSSSSRPVTDSNISIADLFGFVKRYDKEFDPKPVNKVLLNENGTPKTFYHGTDAQFTAFKPEEIAHREGSFFFAENREDAEAYGRNVYEVYLTGDKLADYDNQPREFYQLRDKRAQVQYLKDRGYDGWYADMDSDGWGELSVFSPTQIKSATDNIGTFDGANPDIRYSITTSNAPTIALRDFRNNMIAMMSIPDGKKKRIGEAINAYAQKLLDNGRLAESDRKEFFNLLYGSGVMTLAADEYFRQIRSAVKDGRVYVPEAIRQEFGEDWNAFRRRANSAGVRIVNDSSVSGIDVWHKELAELFPGSFSEEDTDMRSVLESIVSLAEKGKDERMTLAEYAARLIDEHFISEEEYVFDLERRFDAELRLFAEKAELEVSLRDKQGAANRAKEQLQKERDRNAQAWQKRKEQMEAQRAEREMRELQKKTLKTLQWLSKNRNRAPEELRAKYDEVLGDIDTYAIGAANEMRVSEKFGATWRDLKHMYKSARENDPNFFPSPELDKIVDRLDNEKIGDMDINALRDLYQAAIGLRTEFYNRNNVIAEMNYQLFDDLYLQVSEELEDADAPSKNKVISLGDRLVNNAQLTAVNVIRRMAGWNPGSALYKMAEMLETAEYAMHRYEVDARAAIEEFTKKHEDWVRRADGQGKDGEWIEYDVPSLLALRVGEKPVFGGTVKISMTPMMRVHMYLESKNVENLRHMVGGRTFADRELYAKGERTEAFENGVTVRLAPETVKAMLADMSKEELELARILHDYYNGYAKKEINRTSNILYGYDKAMSQEYAPIYTNENYVNTTPGIYDVTAEGAGNLKSRQHGGNPSYQIGAMDAFDRHVDRTARFVAYAIPVRNWTTLLNWREKNNSMRERIGKKWGKVGIKYIDKVLKDLQTGGNKTEKDEVSETLGKLYSKTITAVFGLNPSVVSKQLGSLAMALPELGMENAPKPGQIAKIDRELIGKYTSELAWRASGNASVETQLMRENPNRIQRNKAVQVLTGGAITAVDQWTASVLWPWAENKVRKEYPELSVGTKEQVQAGESEFYKKVAEVFNHAVAHSQSMADEMHQSKIRKRKDPVTRTFTMFKSDASQAYNQLRQYVGEARYYDRISRDKSKNEAARKAAEAKAKAAKKRVGTAVLGIALNNAWSTMVTLLMALWKNKGKNYRDDDDELTVGSVMEQMTKDFLSGISSMVVGGEEIVEVFGNLITGDPFYDIETPGVDVVNEFAKLLTESAKGAGEFFDRGVNVIKDGGDFGKFLAQNAGEVLGGLKDTAVTVSSYFGIPAGNLEAYLKGTFSHIFPGATTAVEDFLETPAKSDLKGLRGKALDQRVADIMADRGVKISKESAAVLAAMYDAGHNPVIPSAVPSSITIEDVTHDLTETQKQKYAEAWAEPVSTHLEALLNSREYKQASADDKQLMISKVYSMGTAYAKNKLFPEYKLPTWIAEVEQFEAAKMSFPQYLEVQAAYSGIYESKDDGKIKALDFAKWVTEQGFTKEQRNVIRECFGNSAETYYNFIDAGVTEYNAYRTAKAIAELKPTDGRESIVSVQKYRAVIDEQLPASQELLALSQVMTDSDYAKVQAGNAHGITPGVFVTFKELLPRFDEDGNGSFSQEEVERAIDSIGPRTGFSAPSSAPANAINTNLTNAQRAVLWQLANKSWNPSSNPYSVWEGRKVYNDLNGK